MPRVRLDEGLWYEYGHFHPVDGAPVRCIVFYDSEHQGNSIPVPDGIRFFSGIKTPINTKGSHALLMDDKVDYRLYYDKGRFFTSFNAE